MFSWHIGRGNYNMMILPSAQIVKWLSIFRNYFALYLTILKWKCNKLAFTFQTLDSPLECSSGIQMTNEWNTDTDNGGLRWTFLSQHPKCIRKWIPLTFGWWATPCHPLIRPVNLWLLKRGVAALYQPPATELVLVPTPLLQYNQPTNKAGAKI